MNVALKTLEHQYKQTEGEEKASADKVSKDVQIGLGEGALILDR